jgi:hypothetical protein
MQGKNRIAVLHFSHETVTFPTNDTTLAIKLRVHFRRGFDDLRRA